MPRHSVLAHRPHARRRRRRFAGLRPALATATALLSALALTSSAAALEQIGVAGNDAFGYSVAVQADTLVIGSPPERSTDPGAAYVYQRTGDTWNQTAELTPSDSAPGDNFGWSVAIDGDTIVVGAPGRGFVSVFFSPAPPPPPPPPPPAPRPSAKPVLSALEVRPTTIHLASPHSKVRRTGAISFVLSTAATVRLNVARTLPGRADGHKCVKPTRANHRNRHCTRVAAVRILAVRGQAGINAIALTANVLGRVRHPVGHYRLTATPTSASGPGTTRTATFRIVK